jgi:hypothetical protein
VGVEAGWTRIVTMLPGSCGLESGFWLHTVPGATGWSAGAASVSADTWNPADCSDASADACERPMTSGTVGCAVGDVEEELGCPGDEGCCAGGEDGCWAEGVVLAGDAGPA